MMTHTEMDELYELYVLGALESDLASEIESHVADRCEYCLNHIHSAVHTTADLAVLADSVSPAAEVRERLLASIARTPVIALPDRKPVRSRLDQFYRAAVPLLAAACLAIIILTSNSSRKLHTVSDRLTQVSYERDQLRAAVQMLSRRETRTIQFSKGGTPAHGSVLVNRDGGVVLVGSDLPQLASDRTYELWAIPAKGNPIPSGLFRPSGPGNFLHVAPQPVDIAHLAAIAVSVEPLSGSPAPTTKPILVIPVT